MTRDTHDQDRPRTRGVVWKNEPSEIIDIPIQDMATYLGDLAGDGLLADQDIVIIAGIMKRLEGADKPKNVDAFIDERTVFLEINEAIPALPHVKTGDLVEIDDETSPLYDKDPDTFDVWQFLPGFREVFAHDDREKGEQHVEEKAAALAAKIQDALSQNTF